MKPRFAVLALVCLSAAAQAAPPPPPDPQKEAAFQAASCGGKTEAAMGESVSVTVSDASIALLGGANGKVGELRFDWGVRIDAADPRFGGIVGLSFDNRLGLVAITNRGNWINFDIEQGRLDKLKNVTIAPMRGISGPPSAILLAGQSDLVSVPGRILRFDLSDCGTDALGQTLAATASDVRALAGVAYSYTLFAGDAADAVRRYDALGSESLMLDKHAVPDLPGYRLIAASGPERIDPYDMLGLWRHGDAQTAIRSFNMAEWSDTPNAPERPPQILARVPLVLRTLFAFYDFKKDEDFITIATEAAPGQPTYIFRLTWKPPS